MTYVKRERGFPRRQKKVMDTEGTARPFCSGRGNPLRAEIVATRPAEGVDEFRELPGGFKPVKSPVLRLWPTCAEESCLSSPVFKHPGI
jgi:hypothetical protein